MFILFPFTNFIFVFLKLFPVFVPTSKQLIPSLWTTIWQTTELLILLQSHFFENLFQIFIFFVGWELISLYRLLTHRGWAILTISVICYNGAIIVIIVIIRTHLFITHPVWLSRLDLDWLSLLLFFEDHLDDLAEVSIKEITWFLCWHFLIIIAISLEIR